MYAHAIVILLCMNLGYKRGHTIWLVFGSQRGGEVACRLYSLMLSCKQCGAEPEAYLEDTLMKVATTPASEIASLTPWAWQAARQDC